MRILDFRAINNGLRNKDILRSGGMIKPLFRSWFLVWWWLKRTYAVLYCIEVDSVCIGLIGLYNMQSDRSAEMTLVIFDSHNRGLGYGSRAFDMFSEMLKKYFLRIKVRVAMDNHLSTAFWEKLGFREFYRTTDIKMLHKEVCGATNQKKGT